MVSRHSASPKSRLSIKSVGAGFSLFLLVSHTSGCAALKASSQAPKGLKADASVGTQPAGRTSATSSLESRREMGPLARTSARDSSASPKTLTSDVAKLSPSDSAGSKAGEVAPKAGAPPQPSVSNKATSDAVRADSFRRQHLAFQSDLHFAHFRSLWSARRSLQDDIKTLLRFIEEASRNLTQADSALLNEFGIQPDRQYRYETADQTILELPSDRSAEEVKPRIVRRLQRAEDRERFVNLVQTRDSLRLQIQGFNLALREKRAALEALRDRLYADYSLSRDREYEIDDSAKVIWEIVPRPAALSNPKAN